MFMCAIFMLMLKSPYFTDIVYTRTWEEAWLDPANWRTEGHNARDPVPHLERVPCTHDRIEFPAASSFRVRLPEVPVTVGSISLLGQVTLGPRIKLNITALGLRYLL